MPSVEQAHVLYTLSVTLFTAAISRIKFIISHFNANRTILFSRRMYKYVYIHIYKHTQTYTHTIYLQSCNGWFSTMDA